jgi:hypothetical protein
MTMLNPAQLNRKLIAVVGGNFNEFDNPFTGFGLTYGNFDAISGPSAPTSTR